MDKSQGQKLYGLIGYPVKHSFSALMHNAAFRHLGLNAQYQLVEIAPKDLETFFKKTVFEKQFAGFNVTVPHKEKAVAYLDGSVDLLVQKIGAVNTVCVDERQALSGYNTDAEGFARDLKEKGVAIAHQQIALIGAGGGAKAVAYACAAQTPECLRIFDVDQAKAEALKASLEKAYASLRVEVVKAVEDLKIRQAHLLINATPVGMKPEDPLLIPKDALHEKLFVYDLIYNPIETKLLHSAKEAGCRGTSCLGMLLYQGCLAFEHWTSQSAPVEVMRRALMEKIYA